jgi:hypothetical protein
VCSHEGASRHHGTITTGTGPSLRRSKQTSLERPLLALLDLGDRDLPIDAVAFELDLVADLHLLKHGRILDAEDH